MEADRNLPRYRNLRNSYLSRTDWTMLPDVELSKKERESYKNYRKYLRKYPELYRLKVVDIAPPMSYEEWKKSIIADLNIDKFR